MFSMEGEQAIGGEKFPCFARQLPVYAAGARRNDGRPHESTRLLISVDEVANSVVVVPAYERNHSLPPYVVRMPRKGATGLMRWADMLRFRLGVRRALTKAANALRPEVHFDPWLLLNSGWTGANATLLHR